ncbi:cellular retinoic acid-binding protein 2 isoform X1 [Onychostruthus taczanowskii]|uniref:cellular retinoic acid-binding protein 2 isoform X1 n=3 Tax=Passeridae TaxID=9158 RepID=UPI001B80A2D4|nr:cellular retinoic acid-binding protein 2 isoform X1 [Onychostruthus taczanowskii]
MLEIRGIQGDEQGADPGRVGGIWGAQAARVVPLAGKSGRGAPLGSHSAGERGAPGPGPGPGGGTSPAIKRRRGRDGTDGGSEAAAGPVPRERRIPGTAHCPLAPLPAPPRPAAAMPNFSGNWKMKSSENFEELLKALGVNVMLRKIAVAAAAKPAVEIRQDGESFYIRTSTPVRTTEIRFRVGEEFEEQTVDGRPCKSLARWESENKMVCEQRLLKGEGPRTGWSREMSNDGELILTMTADDVVCTRVYIRE